MVNKKKEIKRLNEIYKGLLKNSGVEIFNDFASFEDQCTIKGQNLIQSKLFLMFVVQSRENYHLMHKNKLLHLMMLLI